MSARRRWTDLPPELLAVVSGRLHDAADYVRFHAVCKPWRESLPASTALRPFFFPWLVAPPSSRHHWYLDMMKFRCVLSKTSWVARADGTAGFSLHSWVARADGTAPWFFSAVPEPTLVDPLTGDTRVLPPFVGDDCQTNMWGMTENSPGVMYDDGTVFFYNFSQWVLDEENYYEKPGDGDDEGSISFTAAILRPGATAWKFVQRWFDMDMRDEELFQISHFFAAYRVCDGNILLHLDGDDHCVDTWHLLPPLPGDHTSVRGEDDLTWDRDSCLESSHVIESCGELLRVSVIIQTCIGQPTAYEVSAPLTVSVHALEEEVDADGRHIARWVSRDGRSFADRVMFLGFPTSFAVEASRFRGGVDDVSGGWVYFLQPRSEVYGWKSLPGVFRYNLIDGKAKFMERVPPDLIDRENEPFMWLMPQPVIAPIQVIREKLESPNTGDPSLEIRITRMEKPPKHPKEPFISFNVQNLPPGMDSSRLCRFLNKHGKVSNVEVTSLGRGCVTMAMETSNKPLEAKDALDGLVLDGYTLEVSEATMEELCVASSCNNHVTIKGM